MSCSTLNETTLKSLNFREKQILKILCQIDIDNGDTFSRILSDNFFTRERGVWIIVEPSLASVKVFFDIRKANESETSEIRRLQLIAFNTTLELRILIEYLIDEKLIYTFPVGDSKNNKQSLYSECAGVLEKQANESFHRVLTNQGRLDLYDNEIKDLNNKVVFKSFELNEFFHSINKNWLNGIYVTEQLKEFVNNDFLTKDEKSLESKSKIEQERFKKSQIVAWAAIGTSLVIAISFQIFSHFDRSKYTIPIQLEKSNETITNCDSAPDSLRKKKINITPLSEADTAEKQIKITKPDK